MCIDITLCSLTMNDNQSMHFDFIVNETILLRYCIQEFTFFLSSQVVRMKPLGYLYYYKEASSQLSLTHIKNNLTPHP